MTHETCPLLDDLPWLKHGFYGHRATVAIPRHLIGEHRFNDDFPTATFYHQTHSAIIATESHEASAPADAAITDSPMKALAVKTADCCPILLACSKTRQVAAVHAGWRGALNDITSATIRTMLASGAEPDTLVAAIGPNIGQASYPVQDDVRERFAHLPYAMQYFAAYQDRWLLDVAGIVAAQIRGCGVAQIWQSDIDTFTHPDYASYRQYHYDDNLSDTRNVSIIMRTA